MNNTSTSLFHHPSLSSHQTNMSPIPTHPRQLLDMTHIQRFVWVESLHNSRSICNSIFLGNWWSFASNKAIDKAFLFVGNLYRHCHCHYKNPTTRVKESLGLHTECTLLLCLQYHKFLVSMVLQQFDFLVLQEFDFFVLHNCVNLGVFPLIVYLFN